MTTTISELEGRTGRTGAGEEGKKGEREKKRKGGGKDNRRAPCGAKCVSQGGMGGGNPRL